MWQVAEEIELTRRQSPFNVIRNPLPRNGFSADGGSASDIGIVDRSTTR